MHPAFSVILFTTLSGAGYGVFAWLGLLVATARLDLFARGGAPTGATPLLVLASALLAMGVLLTAIGLISSTFHLGKPLRAWRAFSQWRSSWLSREGVLALLTYVPALALFALLLVALSGGAGDAGTLGRAAPWAGIALTVSSLLTIACTAMIYACLKPIPAWRHVLVVPVYLVFALMTGLALVAAVVALGGDGALPAAAMRWPAAALALLAIVLAALKLSYWRDIDRTALTVSRGDAVGLPGRAISVFERPHTQDNYLTREMGFVVARKHARTLRIVALLLFSVLPLLLTLLAWWLPAAAAVAFPLAAAACLAGAFVERWLFFAQARHLVTLYY